MNQEKYQPTKEEVQKAYDTMEDNQYYASEERSSEIEVKNDLNSLLNSFKDLPDEQLARYSYDYKYRGVSKENTTLGEIRKNIEAYIKDPDSRWDQPPYIDSGDIHSSYIEILTPEVLENDKIEEDRKRLEIESTEKLIDDFKELKKLGVDLNLFYKLGPSVDDDPEYEYPKFNTRNFNTDIDYTDLGEMAVSQIQDEGSGNEHFHAREPKIAYKPEQILKFAKIIEEYYKNKK